jgi:hypothetical protein
MIRVPLPHDMVWTNIVTYDTKLRYDVVEWLLSSVDSGDWYFDDRFRTNDFCLEFGQVEDSVMFKLRWF